jgi:hypothetical protein
MKTEITSFSMNSSTSFASVAKKEVSLGWSAMPQFPVAAPEMELGWSAMPAFGKAAPTQNDAEAVADLVNENRSARAESNGILSNFWSAVCR